MRGQTVVITGAGAASPYGLGVGPLLGGLRAGLCPLSAMPGAQEVKGMACRVAGLVPAFNAKAISREIRRSMSRMSLLAYLAAREALGAAGHDLGQPLPRCGVSVGTTIGSPDTLQGFFADFISQGGVETVRSTTFFKVMGHAAASNLAVALGCTGRQLAPAAACASGLQAVGLGFEAIAAGREEIMLCGGTEEFHVLTAATFDRIGAASPSDDPLRASLPFHAARNGIVCSEGAGILVLESLEHAQRRGAPVLARVAGFATNTSPTSIVHPDTAAIAECMRMALDDASLRPGDISCVNAHATATEHGDMAEGQAIAMVLGTATPTNSLKGHLGHTLAASGSLELIACLDMMQKGYFTPTLHLDQPDPRCGGIALPSQEIPLEIACLLKNSFALGGCNTSLIINHPQRNGKSA